jgi:thioredoxin reductase (NADPH)
MHNKVVIIGSGPAGLTAALYAARANLEPLVVRGLQPGGLIATTAEVENYPGFVEGIGGFELADNMEKQAARFGARFLDTMVTRVDAGQRPFVLTTDDGQQLTADTLIVSTGASPRKLGVPGEEPPVTASSSAARRWWWSAAAIAPSTRACSSPATSAS